MQFMVCEMKYGLLLYAISRHSSEMCCSIFIQCNPCIRKKKHPTESDVPYPCIVCVRLITMFNFYSIVVYYDYYLSQ